MVTIVLELDLDFDFPVLKGMDVTSYVANYVTPVKATVLETNGTYCSPVVELTFADKGQAHAWAEAEGLGID